MVALVRAPADARLACAALNADGGGGNGAIPTPFLSLAAAAAAAEAYLSGSPGVRVGIGAGFIEFDDELETPGKGVCSVASAGRGDLSCVDGLRAPDCAASATLDFALRLVVRVSGSGVSSCID